MQAVQFLKLLEQQWRNRKMIFGRWNDLQRQTIVALNDYANAYNYLFFANDPYAASFAQTVQERAKQAVTKYNYSSPILKSGEILRRIQIPSEDQDFVNELFLIVDAANNYLKSNQTYDPQILILLRSVLNSYCYGEHVK